MFLAPLAILAIDDWWNPNRPTWDRGWARWAEDYWRQRAPVPAKRSKRSY